MSGRRDRIPTGRTNTQSYDSNNFATDNNMRSSRDYNNNNGYNSARNNLDSARSGFNTARSELSVNEILRRMREKCDGEKNAQMTREINALGPYNSFSRPRVSQNLPLRSVFLDPTINNFPPSKTRTELLKRIRISGEPHPSYDLDNDGYVSQEDYRLAKRFDFDGNGVLDAGERHVGKQVLAEEFFQRHKNNLHIFGPNIAVRSHKENVEKLVNSYSFERAYEKLLQVERTSDASAAKKIVDCMKGAESADILKHNFYSNKFDATAWNDLEAIPRSTSKLSLDEHGGSRKRLLFTKKENLRNEVSEIMLRATFKGKQPENYRRTTLITDPKVENN